MDYTTKKSNLLGPDDLKNATVFAQALLNNRSARIAKRLIELRGKPLTSKREIADIVEINYKKLSFHVNKVKGDDTK